MSAWCRGGLFFGFRLSTVLPNITFCCKALIRKVVEVQRSSDVWLSYKVTSKVMCVCVCICVSVLSLCMHACVCECVFIALEAG